MVFCGGLAHCHFAYFQILRRYDIILAVDSIAPDEKG